MAKNSARDKLAAVLADLDDAPDVSSRLAAVRRVQVLAHDLERAEIRAARKQGASWNTIGAAYGLTKQGAQQRFRDSVEPPRREQ